jgi:hypothetical protein
MINSLEVSVVFFSITLLFLITFGTQICFTFSFTDSLGIHFIRLVQVTPACDRPLTGPLLLGLDSCGVALLPSNDFST